MSDSHHDPSASPEAISLRQLDPSPVDSSPIVISSDPFDDQTNGGHSKDTSRSRPPSSSASSSRPASPLLSRLGLNNRDLTSTLNALQKYSIYPFTAFLVLHITNTSIFPLALSNSDRELYTSDNLLLLTRPYYQSPLFEPALILIPLATHVLSGLLLRLHRRRISIKRHGGESRSDRRQIPWPKVSTQSLLGWSLVPLLAGHTFINRIWPLYVEGDSSGVGLRFVAHGFAKHPLLANIGYAALVCVASWHVVGGAAKYLNLSPPETLGDSSSSSGGGRNDNRSSMSDILPRYDQKKDGRGVSKQKKRRSRRWWVVNGIAAAMATAWMLGGMGVVGRAGKGLGARWEVQAWERIYRTVPAFGAWM